MRTVTYTGLSDARVLEARDLATAGVDGFRKTTFRPFEPVEVEDDVAEVLVNRPEVFGRDFKVEEVTPEAVVEDPAAGDKLLVDKPAGEKGTRTARTRTD